MAQLPHISRHPSTNLTKICHIDQSYPKTGGKTTRKDIRVVPGQEAKPSELSFLGHRWRNCLLSWDKFDRCEIFHLGSPRKTDPPPSVKFPLANSGKNSFSGDLVGSVLRGQAKWQSGKLPERRRLQKIAPKSGCKCPHRWRNSLISPDIHQPT